jgi:hypothetical protein
MGFWSYLAFGWMFSAKFSLAQFTPASAAVIIALFLVGIFFWWVALMGVFGKIEVRLDGDDGRIFTGFGPFGWTQRFKRSEITAVGEFTRTDEPDIFIQGKKRIRFGSWLSTSRRRYMIEVLDRLLL